MQIKGKVIVVGQVEVGTSNAKEWSKQNIVIEEIDATYPKKIALQSFGKIVETTKNLKIGQIITAHINIESREYNSKWYTNVGVWKIDFEGVTNSTPAEVSTPIVKVEDDSENLPF